MSIDQSEATGSSLLPDSASWWSSRTASPAPAYTPADNDSDDDDSDDDDGADQARS